MYHAIVSNPLMQNPFTATIIIVMSIAVIAAGASAIPWPNKQ